jgi:hypothetical protein
MTGNFSNRKAGSKGQDMSIERKLWEEYLADVSVPEGLPAHPKPILKPWQSVLLALATVSVAAMLAHPDDWGWDVVAFIIWGGIGGFFTREIWFLIEFKRRLRLYVRASVEERRVLLKLWSQRPLPLHPICILVVTAITALGGLNAARNYDWDVTMAITAVVALGLLILLQIRYCNLCDSFERNTSNPLDATGKKSVLMGQSANFPTEDEHKRSSKFK